MNWKLRRWSGFRDSIISRQKAINLYAGKTTWTIRMWKTKINRMRLNCYLKKLESFWTGDLSLSFFIFEIKLPFTSLFAYVLNDPGHIPYPNSRHNSDHRAHLLCLRKNSQTLPKLLLLQKGFMLKLSHWSSTIHPLGTRLPRNPTEIT